MFELAIVFATVAAGSFLQRVSGMGLALLSAPILSLLMGPVVGVLVVNLLAFLNAAMATTTVRAWIDWKKFSLIASVLVVGSVPGAYLVRMASPALLQVLVGSLLLIALAVVVYGQRWIPPIGGRGAAITSGIVAGFMNTTAGVAGPVVTVYAVASAWEQRSFTATLQPIFMVAGLISLVSKLVLGAGTISDTNIWVWPIGIFGMLLGNWLGLRLADRIPRSRARTLSLVVAATGGASALGRGLLTL